MTRAAVQSAVLVALAASMPAADFARLADTTPRVAQRIARGDLPRPGTVRHILAALRRAETAPRTCALPACELPARHRSLTCSEAHKKRLARLTAGGGDRR